MSLACQSGNVTSHLPTTTTTLVVGTLNTQPGDIIRIHSTTTTTTTDLILTSRGKLTDRSVGWSIGRADDIAMVISVGEKRGVVLTGRFRLNKLSEESQTYPTR